MDPLAQLQRRVQQEAEDLRGEIVPPDMCAPVPQVGRM
jgi:hypothetical protein